MQTYRLHPALDVSTLGPVVEDKPLHVQQSNLDGACGVCCALMALMAFGFVQRNDLPSLPHCRKKRLRALWRRTSPHYFDGLYPGQLLSMFDPYARELAAAIELRDCVPCLLDALGDGGLGIVCIENKAMSHWVLAVGASGEEAAGRFLPKRLLMLDPSEAPIPLTPWNGVLALRADRLRRHAYDTPVIQARVRLGCVVLLRRHRHARR